MPWTDRQRQMLQAMGVRIWAPVGRIQVSQSPTPAAVVPMQAAQDPPTPDLPDGHAAIARMDWDALQRSVAACTACGLCATRTQTVFGAGSRQAHWLVVGEAPGEHEDAQGQPFVGPAGQLLDRMLAALSLTRSVEGPKGPERRAMIVNTLKCRPPRNRNPQPDEMAACAPFLARQVELLQPRVILALGRFAVQALLASEEPIGRMRGRVHRAQAFGGRPVVVSYHPSYLLRQPLDKAKAWEDLCLAAAVAEGTA